MNHFLRIAALLALVAFPSLAEAANRFAVCTTTCTWDGSNLTMWSAASGGATGASVPGAADAVILDAATCVGGTTCTITVNTNPTVLSITIGACTASTTGCILDFSVNNNSPTVSGFSITGAGTRNLKCGSGTFTMTGAGTPWDAGTTTGLTFNCASATLNFATNAAFAGQTSFNAGSQSYGTVIFNGTNANGNAFNFNNAATIATLNITAPALVVFSSAITVTNAVNWAGSSSALIQLMTPPNFGTINVTLSAAGGVASWATIRGLVFVTNSLTATNSYNVGGVTNATITSPSFGSGRIIGG